jgi:hypothetical protein
MSISVHLPKALLEEVKRRARDLKMSRNHYIVSVLENEVKRPTTWSAKFLAMVQSLGPESAEFADVLEGAIKARTSRAAPGKS